MDEFINQIQRIHYIILNVTSYHLHLNDYINIVFSILKISVETIFSCYAWKFKKIVFVGNPGNALDYDIKLNLSEILHITFYQTSCLRQKICWYVCFLYVSRSMSLKHVVDITLPTFLIILLMILEKMKVYILKCRTLGQLSILSVKTFPTIIEIQLSSITAKLHFQIHSQK